ncbi:PREDICTED: uncharacterized protein LOC104803442 [Tarenaya hassleriana]|uniref:uncharacterized protein LOC104803442 n=1 Tax=Tarenaya hassleriana TaxID=28532 RepID=UPI00053C162E|nr:PREDICTED: uncharacterized protein LOC104803442 [Tarenaya hassleriana]
MKLLPNPPKPNLPPPIAQNKPNETKYLPSMSEIMTSSRDRKLDLRIQTVGPFFRVTANNAEGGGGELGRAEGVVRPWFGCGKILHLDSIKLKPETLALKERSLLGVGLFVGAVAVRYGYDCGCTTAQLLAIYDSDVYHSKLVRFYKRMGFEAVYEVKGSSMGDMAHMLTWGGVGTLMDADVEDLLLKWSNVFTKSTA